MIWIDVRKALKYYKTEMNIWENVSGLLDMMKITNQLLYCPNILVMTSMTFNKIMITEAI